MIAFSPGSAAITPPFDPTANGAGYLAVLSGLLEQFEQDNLGRHTSDTIDSGIVLDSRIWIVPGAGQ